MDAHAVLDRWGIKALSPSSLTCWANDRTEWVIRYALKQREAGSPAMNRGHAVEAGFNALLHGEDLTGAQRIAADLFKLKLEEDNLLEADGVDDEAVNIVDMVSQAAEAIREHGFSRPTGTQLKCETWIDGEGWSAPVTGYADFCFPDQATLDCKSTLRMPSEVKPAHVAQVSVYAKARNEPVQRLLYLTPKKRSLMVVQGAELDAAFRLLTLHARSLLRALYRAKTADDLCADFPPPIDSWSWTPERREMAATLSPAWAT